jgi:hypothetical protein
MKRYCRKPKARGTPFRNGDTRYRGLDALSQSIKVDGDLSLDLLN